MPLSPPTGPHGQSQGDARRLQKHADQRLLRRSGRRPWAGAAPARALRSRPDTLGVRDSGGFCTFIFDDIFI